VSAPRVVGLDLSITATGWCGADGAVETWKLPAKRGDGRLREIYNLVRSWRLMADVVCIEDLPTHAHGAGITGMVHGVTRLALRQDDVPYVLVPPASLKKYATGKGNAGKPEMAVALYKRTGLELGDDNQVDAAWLRLMALDGCGHPEVDMPATHRVALEKITWPSLPAAVRAEGET
jgi:Holliday junction resolvasome RuvABC endonuclease subunit